MDTAKKNKIVSMNMSDNRLITTDTKLNFVKIIKEVITADMATNAISLMGKGN